MIVVVFIVLRLVSLLTFAQLSAQNSVKTASSSPFCYSGNTDVSALFISVRAFRACAVSMSSTVSYDPQ